MNWEKKEVPAELVKDLSAKYGCDLLTASILARRGLTEGETIRYFLEDDPRYLRNPFELPGMEDAVDRILAAKEEGEKILVFGDRDVDGITSTALLSSFLMDLGMDVRWQVPMGDESYGLSVKAVEEFAADYGTLIITVDCGISNIAEIARAAELGVDVIVTDHHNPQDDLPQALTIVNPKLRDSPYPFRDLAGCGVAYKLVSALRFALKSELYGQPLCILNTRPANDAFIIEIVKMRNLAEIDRLTETVVPGMVSLGETRIPGFLQGQQILAWDVPLQKKTLAKIFGNGTEFYIMDLAPEIGRDIPSTAGKSLLRIKELSRIARYSENPLTELDILINLFITFVQRRENFFGEDDPEDLQLAALGTLADLMPLRDENRIIVRGGIAALMKKARPGLSNLLFKLGLAGRHIGTQEISWQLCPAINAAGRMGSPDKAVALLLEKDPKERDRLADEIITMNENRKKLGGDVWTIVEPLAEQSLETYGSKMVLAAGENIIRGVTGIMATRLVNRFKVPAMVVSFGEETATGSLRSVKGYDLRGILEQCADLFIDWGGHDYAAGFSMYRNRWDDFQERLKAAVYTIELREDTDEETILVDAELPQAYLTPDIFRLLDQFEPYGEGNSPLTFMARGLKVTDLNLMGKTEAKHVKLTLDAGRHKWPAVYWQAAEKVKKDFDLEDTVDLVFRLSRNWFNGIETPQLIITDIRRP
ncbi:single-stranded-DNA-specific exonuclease RecJ [Breznakiella homolactica]|uniref:Single-stranded-DNA-specific exonuclease RecJ n=1 Tax=Breznakiella homolactica TaxID=2798577 RepID=A0A7T7XME8_9SPIR|nr:single-stranded-DNA-specific exonuclease RecJ [Breznakiella homolactica]QQO09054.1 single-stranded-DNA-specific exonuclease RecJ [Breznakiella homolactica]